MGSDTMQIGIITACPGGRTTAWLAAQRLTDAASRAGHTSTWLEQAQATCDIYIVAASTPVDLSAYQGLPVYKADMTEALANPEQVVQMALDRARPYDRQQDEQAAAPYTGSQSTRLGARIVGVTACPTGVAHTFMAAQALSEAGQLMGHDISLETQGSIGTQDQLSEQAIQQADVVVLACDIQIDTTRFAGKPVYRTTVAQALKNPRQVLGQALNEAEIESRPSQWHHDIAFSSRQTGIRDKGIYKHLLTGVSFMLPLVVTGGLCLALAYLLGLDTWSGTGSLPSALQRIGAESALRLMLPVLAGYIAYSIADRPGLAPGLIGGWLAADMGSGFVGAILAGFISGYSAQACKHLIKLPTSLNPLNPILIIPLLSTLVTGLTMIYLVNPPMAGLLAWLTGYLQSLAMPHAVLLGALLGAMMCLDMGGPVNKAAYTFSLGLLPAQIHQPMAAVMAAGMIPPLSMGLASLLYRSRFTDNEREAGRAALVLGLCFVTEGAIPFAARDPFRVIPINLIGGSLTGAASMYISSQLIVPHGGVFVLLIPHAVTQPLLYLAVIAAGAFLTGGLYTLIKPRLEQPSMFSRAHMHQAKT